MKEKTKLFLLISCIWPFGLLLPIRYFKNKYLRIYSGFAFVLSICITLCLILKVSYNNNLYAIYNNVTMIDIYNVKMEAIDFKFLFLFLEFFIIQLTLIFVIINMKESVLTNAIKVEEMDSDVPKNKITISNDACVSNDTINTLDYVNNEG